MSSTAVLVVLKQVTFHRPWLSAVTAAEAEAANARCAQPAQLAQPNSNPRTPPPAGVPRVLHYGLLYSVVSTKGKWTWDKHWFHEFDVHKCPPWDLEVEHPQEGLFPHPPLPGELLPHVSSLYRCVMSLGVCVCVYALGLAAACLSSPSPAVCLLSTPTLSAPPPTPHTHRHAHTQASSSQHACLDPNVPVLTVSSHACLPLCPLPPPTHPQLSKAERYRDLIAISVVHTLNAALCEFHTTHCPPSEQLRVVCGRAMDAYREVKEAVRALDVEMSCVDELVGTRGGGGGGVLFCAGVDGRVVGVGRGGRVEELVNERGPGDSGGIWGEGLAEEGGCCLRRVCGGRGVFCPQQHAADAMCVLALVVSVNVTDSISCCFAQLLACTAAAAVVSMSTA